MTTATVIVPVSLTNPSRYAHPAIHEDQTIASIVPLPDGSALGCWRTRNLGGVELEGAPQIVRRAIGQRSWYTLSSTSAVNLLREHTGWFNGDGTLIWWDGLTYQMVLDLVEMGLLTATHCGPATYGHTHYALAKETK